MVSTSLKGAIFVVVAALPLLLTVEKGSASTKGRALKVVISCRQRCKVHASPWGGGIYNETRPPPHLIFACAHSRLIREFYTEFKKGCLFWTPILLLHLCVEMQRHF